MKYDMIQIAVIFGRGETCMTKEKRMSGKERRAFILNLLQKSDSPIPGKTLADETGVSRQVIVTDIALLKTQDLPIIGTNRGYLIVDDNVRDDMHRRVIVCQHTPEETRAELEAIVDSGVTVLDTIVEHPFYGELTGSLMIRSRYDVEQFVNVMEGGMAGLLSELTDGVHIHTLEADSIDKLNRACTRLATLGILVEETT